MEETVGATFCAAFVDELVATGLTDAVVCPGSRSTPLALAFDADDRVRVHVQVDERSGAFLALGLGRGSGRPAAVVTTSGTAAVELHPAVVEARYDAVPLLACTADRPPELHDVGAPQTIDQRRLYGTGVAYLRADVTASPSDPASDARALARRAQSSASGPPAGPVQVDLPFRDPLVGAPGPFADGASVWSVDGGAGDGRGVDPDDVDLLRSEVSGRAGVIVAGGAIADPAAVLDLASRLGWPVLADPRSGCRVPHPNVVAHFDALLRCERVFSDRPEVVLRLGSLPASKVLTQWLSALDGRQIGVDGAGRLFAPDRRLGFVIAADPGAIARELEGDLTGGVDAASRWVRWDRDAASAIAGVVDGSAVLSEPGMARAVIRSVPDGGAAVVSSSMPIRDVEWYAEPRTGLAVHANRGANGIDGVVSTALGVALSGVPTVALLGDLAFLHDSNGLLASTSTDVSLTIVVTDNDGGGIFSFLPQRADVDHASFERLFGTPHGLDLVAVAEAFGVEACAVESPPELHDALQRETTGLRVVVARTDRSANVPFHDEIHAAVAAAVR